MNSFVPRSLGNVNFTALNFLTIVNFTTANVLGIVKITMANVLGIVNLTAANFLAIVICVLRHRKFYDQSLISIDLLRSIDLQRSSDAPSFFAALFLQKKGAQKTSSLYRASLRSPAHRQRLSLCETEAEAASFLALSLKRRKTNGKRLAGKINTNTASCPQFYAISAATDSGDAKQSQRSGVSGRRKEIDRLRIRLCEFLGYEELYRIYTTGGNSCSEHLPSR
jgi:hypothetical protein